MILTILHIKAALELADYLMWISFIDAINLILYDNRMCKFELKQFIWVWVYLVYKLCSEGINMKVHNDIIVIYDIVLLVITHCYVLYIHN